MDTGIGPRTRALLRRCGAALLLAVGLYLLTAAVVRGLFRTDNMADYPAHTLWAIVLTPQDALASLWNGSERLWHICVRVVFGLTKNMITACVVVTALANAAAYLLVFFSLEAVCPEKCPRWLLALLVAAVFTANALTAPGCPFVTDRGYVNPWHNPTNIMVRPFAAAVFYMTLRIYNRRRCAVHALWVSENGAPFSFAERLADEWRVPVFTPAELVLYPLCLLLSVYAKPAFLQFFAPAIFLFLLIDVIRTKGRLLPFCVKLALAYLPAVLVLGSQFLYYFGGFSPLAEAQSAADTLRAMEEAAGETIYYDATSNFDLTGIAFYYILPSFSGVGEVLAETGKALLLTLYLVAFPLAVFLAESPADRRSAAWRLGWWGVIAARLESLLLHELGIRVNHGNFRWAYFVAVWLLWTIAAVRWIAGVGAADRQSRLLRWAATPLLLWHLAVGVVYLVRILQTSTYWF